MGMTSDYLRAIIDCNVNGATFASLDTQTTVTLLGGKKNWQQGRIYKRCLGNRVMLFSNKQVNGYEAQVKRRLEAAGLDPNSFVLSSLPWGERISGTPLITHKDKVYLQCVFMKPGNVRYFISDDNGDFYTIAKEQILGFNDKSGSEHQGLERDSQVIVRTYAADSIRCIRAFSEIAECEDDNDIGLWSETIPYSDDLSGFTRF
jgi:hypothetical protein